MRTTLTIDDDLMTLLKAEAHRRRLPLKGLVNKLLRLGLERLSHERPKKPYRLPSFSMGALPSGTVDLDKALALATALEDEVSARKLEQRK